MGAAFYAALEHEGNGINMLKNFQKSLLISTAIPVAFMAASAAQARDVSVPAPVAPATSVPGTTVNAAIVTAITAPDDANLKLTVPSAGRSEEHTSELQSLMRI